MNYRNYLFDFLSPQQHREIADAIDACERGDAVEILGPDGTWQLCNPQWAPNKRYRRAPVPVERPWNNPSDVPGPVCWLRIGSGGEIGDAFVASIFNQGCAVARRHDTIVYTWHDIEKYGSGLL